MRVLLVVLLAFLGGCSATLDMDMYWPGKSEVLNRQAYHDRPQAVNPEDMDVL